MAEQINERQYKQPPWRRKRRWGLWLIIGLPIIGYGITLWASQSLINKIKADQRQTPALSAVELLSLDQHREVEAADRPAIGEKNPAVVIVEFSDFICTECNESAQTVREIASEYGTSVRLIYRDFVDQTNSQSVKLAEAGKCAHAQGKFWLFHDRFRLRPDANDPAGITTLAQGIGLDMAAFTNCLDHNTYSEMVQADYQAGRDASVRGVPTFFINGHRIEGGLNKQDFYDILDLFIPELNPGNIESDETNASTLN